MITLAHPFVRQYLQCDALYMAKCSCANRNLSYQYMTTSSEKHETRFEAKKTFSLHKKN